jgi:hypothetical protein
MGFEEMAVKTIPGTTPGSVYIVAFEGDGLRVSVRPFVNIAQPLLSLALRVRVESMAPDGAVALASQYFGMPFEVKGGHASLTMAVPVMAVPFGPKEANDIIFSKGLIAVLVDDLYAKITAHSKMKPLLEKETMFEVIANQVQDQLPTDTICAVDHAVYYNDLSPVLKKIMAAMQSKQKPKK